MQEIQGKLERASEPRRGAVSESRRDRADRQQGQVEGEKRSKRSPSSNTINSRAGIKTRVKGAITKKQRDSRGQQSEPPPSYDETTPVRSECAESMIETARSKEEMNMV